MSTTENPAARNSAQNGAAENRSYTKPYSACPAGWGRQTMTVTRLMTLPTRCGSVQHCKAECSATVNGAETIIREKVAKRMAA